MYYAPLGISGWERPTWVLCDKCVKETRLTRPWVEYGTGYPDYHIELLTE